MTVQFNPFEDRLSRDIRNDLSESLPAVLSNRSLQPALTAADTYRQLNPAPVYLEYIEQRLKNYRTALELVVPSSELDPLPTAAVLWDLGLFFEVHELLEPEWMEARGDRKLLLQALIRAAGVYVYREVGYPQRAAKIAAKAVPVLRRFREMLLQDLRIDDLIAALEHPGAAPPPLSRGKPDDCPGPEVVPHTL